jgi:hypothetical protein
VETLKGWDGDKDDNSLLAVANFNLNLIKVSMRAPRFIENKWSAARPIPQLSVRHPNTLYAQIDLNRPV